MSDQTLDEVRVGIIGPSWWVDYWHLAGIKCHPIAEIHAVTGSSTREEGEVTRKYGVQARYYTDYDQMMDFVPLDGIIVCTPNDLHYPATMAALKRGLHVLCEKPIALNSAEAREMHETATARDLVAMTNFPYRDNPCIQEMKRRIADGYLGKVLHVSGQYHGGFGLKRSPNWRGYRDRSGAGILGDLGSHLIDLARYAIADEFSAVCGHSLTVLHNDESDRIDEVIRSEDPRAGNRNDDSCAFLAEFSSGAQGIFHTSWIAYQGAYCQHQELEVYGTEGRLHFIATHAGTQLKGMRSDADKRWEVFSVPGTTPPQADSDDEDWFRPGRKCDTSTTYRWLEAIAQGDKSITPSLADGLEAQRVIDAVIQASAERRWVALEEIV